MTVKTAARHHEPQTAVVWIIYSPRSCLEEEIPVENLIEAIPPCKTQSQTIKAISE